MFKNNFLQLKIPAQSKSQVRIVDLSNLMSENAISTTSPSISYKTISSAGVILTALAFLLITFRLLVVQVYTAPIWQDWSSRSSGQQIFTIPPRGRILDVNGKVIVDSKVSFSIITSIKNLQDQNKKDLIKAKLDLSETDLNEEIKNGYAGFVTLKEGLSLDKMLTLADLSNQLEIELIPTYTRSYLDKSDPDQQYKIESLGSVVGYTGLADQKLIENLDKNIYKSDSKVGLAGLEKYYEPLIQGTPGKIERRSVSKSTNQQDRIVTDPILGSDLKTTIDLNLQLRLYDLAKDEFQQANLKSGSIILMDADTGAIKTMINFPNFNPDSFEDKAKQFKLSSYFSDKLRPLFDRSAKGQYPPGSSIKPFVGAVAMQNDIIKPGQTILDKGSITVKSKIIQGRVDQYINYKSNALGVLDLATALAKSSDVFFYYLIGGDPETGKIPFINNADSVNPLGIDKLNEGLNQYFGFGSKTGIDLPQENIGLVPSTQYKEKKGFGSWLLGDSYQSAIGQGFFLVTPLQMARAAAVLANGGFLVTPHLKADLNTSEDKKITGLKPEVVDYISKGMRQVVISGTAKRLQDNQSKIAAKTGSAQYDPNRPEMVEGWVVSFNQDQGIIKDKLVLVVLTEDIDKTAEYITVPITNKLWQAIEYQYKVDANQINQ